MLLPLLAPYYYADMKDISYNIEGCSEVEKVIIEIPKFICLSIGS